LISILVRLEVWTTSIQDSEFEISLPANNTADIIEHIAKTLSEGTSGTEQQILMKSLQETLFICVGFKMDLDGAQLKTRLKRYLDRHGKTTFIRKFLCHHFFNFVWFQVGESFRVESSTCDSFEQAMTIVDEICQKAVTSVLSSPRFKNHSLDRSLAEKLIDNIEERLHGE
jgi:hypothetical protein